MSHGDEAGLHLGSNWLSADTIAMRSNTLAQWQGLLTADADVLYYGCDLAANPSGQEFLRTFGQLTGADVGASTDATGAAILGGDWNLEFQYGDVETRSLGESTSLFEWNGLLTTNTYQQGVSSYTGTQDTTISAATPSTGNGASSTVTIGGASAKTGLISSRGSPEPTVWYSSVTPLISALFMRSRRPCVVVLMPARRDDERYGGKFRGYICGRGGS